MDNKKIKKNNMISEILNDIPEFYPVFQKACEYWDGKENFPSGLQLSEFVSFLFQNIEEKKYDNLKKAFSKIEYFLENGDQEVKNYIYFMFIESFINRLAQSDYDHKIIEPYLGPLSRKAYDRINAFWMEGKVIDSLD